MKSIITIGILLFATLLYADEIEMERIKGGGIMLPISISATIDNSILTIFAQEKIEAILVIEDKKGNVVYQEPVDLDKFDPAEIDLSQYGDGQFKMTIYSSDGSIAVGTFTNRHY